MKKEELLNEFLEDQKTSAIIDLEGIKPEMDRTFKDGKPRGEITHFPAIDKINNFTWKKGFLYCITGNPQSGKSEFLNTLTLLKSINSNWRWMVYSPESYPVMDYIDTLIHTLVGKSTDPKADNQMSKAHYDKSFEFVKKHYFPIDFDFMPTCKQVEECFLASDCDGLIIDPYNSLDDEGKTFYDFLKSSLSEWKRIARKYNKVIILIEHPHGANSLDESGNPREPNEYTLSGGKMWHNKCDVIGVMHRPLVFSDPMATNVTFRTRKVKNQKLNGFPEVVEFNFDRDMNRYYKLMGEGRVVTGFEKNEQKPLISENDYTNYKGFSEEAGF